MNSATLTDAKARLKAPAKPVAETGVNRTDDGFHAWHFFVLVSILLATVAVVLTRRSTPENLVFLSFTIAAAGLAAAALYRTLLPLTVADPAAFDQPMTERYRAVLERDKALTLRTIKELEFDHAMGKISKKDYDEMVARLRQRALTIMRQLDEGRRYTGAIEEDLKKRLGAPAPASAPAARAVASVCACGASLDEDSVFCKKCGTRVRA